MSQPAIGQKQTTVLLLVMVVLLAAIVAVLVWQNTRSASDVAPISAAPTNATDVPANMPPGMGAQAPAADFDPAAAPTVPADMTPAEFVYSYYETCAAKDYDQAFTMLPIATQQNYGDASSFKQTLESYGISDFSVDEPVESGETYSVVGYQVAQGMSFGYEWSFVKGDTGEWLLQSRTMK